MTSKYPKFIALSLVLMLVISGIAYFVMLTAQNYTPLARMKNAQDVAKMSGEYQFRTDIDQVSGYAPSITNYGRESRHDQLVVEGTINESTQTSTMTISNANGVMLEVRRERGQTYARRPGTGWQRTASNSTAQINTLSYLAGMTNAKVVGSDGNSFDFGFDGNAFATHFARLLSADAAHGIKYSDEWYSIAQSNQFKEANGNGNLTLDSDGLPKNMTLNLTMPGNNNNGTVQTSIKTSFFAYARTGLALKKVLNNPFTLVGNLLGTDTSAVKTVLFSLLAVLAVTIIGVLVHLFRTRLYLPVTLLALGMLVFQPFSNIPRSYAATSEESAPTPGPDSTTPSKPEVTFNPLVSPLQQMGSVVLPSAGTTTANDTVVVSGSQSRSLTTRDGRAITDTPVCGQLGDDIKNLDYDGDGLTNEQECLFETSPTTTDSDADRLNDFAEVQVGTDPTSKDSDLDGLNDNVEVTTFTQYGTGPKFYTNPLQADTNGDGITDGAECNLKLISAGGENDCFDANNDRIPDFISFDDDGDGVPDNYDLSPLTFIQNAPSYTDNAPFKLNVTGMNANKPLTIDIQIRPSNAQLLYTNGAIYDWPSNDTDGQIIRTRDTTYANSDSVNPKSIDAKAANGDMLVTTLLEIKIPISNGNYGGIPVKACPPTPPQSQKLSAIDSNSCVDTEKMTPYGMRAELIQTNATEYDPTQATVYVPLSETKDGNGTIVAYNAEIFYLPTSTTTINAQQVRMKWIVSSIQNKCPTPTSTNKDEDCTADEKIDNISVITSYYSDWKLTGLQTTEHFGTKVAVIYEDGTKPAVTDIDKRRLSIIRTFDLLNILFVKIPVFNIDGTDINKSIPVMFDNTMNNTNTSTTNYGIDKTATKIFTKQYDTMNEVAKLYAEEIPKLLNGVACKNLGITLCTTTNPQPAPKNCKEKTTVQCQPAAITLIESTQRVSSIYDTTDIKIESNTPTTIRSINGNIYKLNDTDKWRVLTTEELSTDLTQIQSNINTVELDNLTTRPEKLTDEEWANLKVSMTSMRLLSFLTTESGRFIDVPKNITIPEDCYVCADRVNYFPIDKVEQLYAEKLTDYSSWTYSHKNELLKYRGEITEFIQQYKEDINNQKANEMLNKANKSMMNAIGKNSIDLQNSIYLDQQNNFKVSIKNAWREVVELINGDSLNIYSKSSKGYYLHNFKAIKYSVGSITSLAGTLSGIVAIGVSIGGVAHTSLGDAKLGKDLINASYGLSIIAATVQLVNYLRAYKAISLGLEGFVDASRAVNNGVKTARMAAAEFKALTNTLQIASKIGKLAKVFTAVALLATWAIAIFKAVNSEYAYQKGNAIAEAVGQTIAIFILLAISSIPIIGPIIALIIIAIDIIAMAICANVSEKQQRSTAGKWLCGGITGIISNFFTPYAGNVVVDPDDEYSHYRSIKPLPPTINSEFKIGNNITNKIKVIDYIERMPFPSTWMALPYFWQWNGQDEREASFAYTLGDQQKDMSYSINTGSQRNNWQSNSVCNTTNSDCEYYVNGDKTYTYRKSVVVDYTQQFTQTGINVQMPDMHLSMATKVPLQTCAIVGFFIVPIPACWIETQTFKPKYINLNDTDKTRYDILPATMDKFVEMQPKDSGYTFKWSPLTAELPFPVFKDADNDGLSNEQEKIYSTSDNAYDTDADGISDDREVALTTNPVLQDSDNDGLTDDLEMQMKTNPSMPDSDGDGLLDGEEVVHAVKDTSGNVTLAGGWEVIYNTAGNSTWVGSDPLNADADGDQITDLREKVLGWSPDAKNSGDIMTASGSVREALLPTIQVGFDSNSISTAFSSSGFVSSNLQCVNTSALTTTITCPTVTTTTDRTLPNSTTMNPYVTLASAQSLDVGNGPQSNFDSQFTIAAWLKPSATTITKLIINRDNLIKVYQTSTGAVRVELTTTKSTYTLTTAIGVLPTGSWKHLAVTYGNQALVAYVDGVEVGRVAVAGNLSTTPTQKLTVGNGYVGGIDDIAVYQVALRAGEITQLKDGALTGGNDLVVKPGDRLVTSITQANKLLGPSIQGYSTIRSVSVANAFQSDQIKTASLNRNAITSFDSIVTVPGAQNLITTPSSYANSCVYASNELCVKFDETASSTKTFTDLSSNQNNLVCTTNCPTFVNSGWNFSTTTNNGTTTLDTKATVGNAISAHDFTIAAWVRPEGQATTLRTIVNSSNTNALMQVALANERPQFSMGSATALVASNALAINSWSHVLYTFAAGKRSIYVNGVMVATDTSTITPLGNFGVLSIGRDARNNAFNGSLRDLQIYSNKLNLLQIKALANSCEDPQLIACLPLNGSANDMSVYGNEQGSVLSNAGSNGALSSSARFPVGYAKLISDHDFTMVTKVKLGSTTANQTIMQTEPAVASGNQFKVTTNLSSIATLSVGTTTLTAGSQLAANTPYIITARFQSGVWSLRVERGADNTLQTTTADFSMTSRVTVGDDANNQTIMQTGAVLNSPNQYQVTTDDTGKAILQRGTTALATGQTLNKNTTYTITATYFNGNWSLTATTPNATNPAVSESETTFVEDTTLHQAQEPLSIGQSGMTINNIRIYRTAVSDTTLAAVARNALFGTLSVALNNPPVSDQLQISVDARGKVIDPDPNFERMPDNCKSKTAVVCLPFTNSEASIILSKTQCKFRINNYLYDYCPSISNGGANFISNGGDNNRVSISDTVSKTTFEGDDKNFTVMTWVRFNTINTNKCSRDETCNEQVIMYDRSDVNENNKRLKLGLKAGNLYFSYYHDRTSTTKPLSGTTSLAPNTWYHVAFVKNGTTRSIYLNGVLEKLDTTPVAGLVSAREMFIGATNRGNSPLNGTLRDFQIHNTALPPDAIGQVADINKAATIKSFELRVPFDEPAVASQFSDVLATGLSLSCLSSTACPLSGRPGRDDRSVHFDGAQGLKFNTNTDQFVDYIHEVESPNFTISMWVRPNTYDTSLLSSQQFRIGINSDGYLSYKQGWNKSWINGKLHVTWPVDPLLSQQQLPLNTWSHITVSTQQEKEYIYEYIYVNGNMTSRTPWHFTSIAIDDTATVKLAETFVGDIDELRISPIATTDATAVQAEMNQAPSWNLTFEDGLDNNRYTSFFQNGTADTGTNNTLFASASTSQSTTASTNVASNILDSNTSTYQSTNAELNPWLQIDLGTSKEINSLDIYNRVSSDITVSARIKTGIIFASDASFSTRTDIAAMKTTAGVVWRNIGCNDTADNCNSSAPIMTVTFPAGTKARYLRIQLNTLLNSAKEPQQQSLHLAEIRPSLASAISGNRVQNAVVLPNDVPGRSGINRFSYAANCDIPEINGVTCPVGNTVGMAGTASLFNGTNTMLQVGNGTTLIDEIKNGGTIQMMIKPDKLTGTQTLLHYGDTNGNTAFQVQIVDGKVKITLGSNVFTSSTPLPLAWNQISFSFGATGFKYFQNGTEDTGNSGRNPLFNSVTIGGITYPLGTIDDYENTTTKNISITNMFDSNPSTNSTTPWGNYPFIQIDLGESKAIYNLDISGIDPDDIIFATNTDFGNRIDIEAMKTSAGTDGWRTLSSGTFTFPTGTKARYLRIQSLRGEDRIQIAEISQSFKNAAITPNTAYKLRIGGKISGSSLSEMFKGGIDDITFTPSTLAPAKVFRIDRSQYSQTMTKTDIASVTIDAEPPVVSITKPNYVARLPQQFVINTSDVSSYVANVTAIITSTRNASGIIINTAQNTAISVPACIDAIGGSAYCPTFGLSQVSTIPIEGKYGFITTASDSVGNVGSAQSTILVDTTPPTATLIRPSGTYKTSWPPNQNIPELTLQLSASDPVLTNSGNSAGSGVKGLSVNLKDAAGRIINTEAPIPATLNAGVWTATIPVPFGNPSGFYQVGAIVTDNVGNQSNEIMVADANAMIEVDASAPRDVISYPSPYNPDNYFVGNQAITGRVSDIGDGRTALQQGLRIRLDFEAPNGAQAVDNRADSRYNTSCSTCPVITRDDSSSSKIARFNIDNSTTAQQSLTVANAATVLTGTFSIAFTAKISDAGTLIGAGVASNPRLRIQVSKVGNGNKFQVTAEKGKTTSVKTGPDLEGNKWYYFIYSEYRDGNTQTISLTYDELNELNVITLDGSALNAIQLDARKPNPVYTITKNFTGVLPTVQPDITIGAMQSNASNTTKEDFFRGYIDDVLLSPSVLVSKDLIGKALAQGSGTQHHLTRLAIDDDGYTGNDRLTDNIDFYMPMNQSSLPAVDAINGIRSSRCTAGFTDASNTCPLLSEGFASNAVLLQQSSDGIKTDYQLQTSASTAKSMALRFKIGVDATSGLLAWLQAPSTSDSLAMQIGYDNDLQSVTVRINDKNTTLLATSEATTAINDNNWHAMVITSTGSGANEQISVHIDGTLVVTKTIAGHWVNATLGLGALTDVSDYSGRDTATAAAINTAIDDLAIFTTALTSANIIDYSFGYSTVYHETFDDGKITPGAITSDDSPYHQPSTITSSDANLTNVVGTVGNAAIAFDGNDEVIHRDPNTLTFAPHNQPWSLSAWVTPKNDVSNGTIISGTLNTYSYELSLIAGKPKFTMAGMSITGTNPIIDTKHIVVSSDGTNLSMYVNGTSVTNTPTPTSSGSASFTRTSTIIPFSSKSQSSTDGSNAAGNGYDGNLSTYSLTTSETNPYWVISNPSSTAMDNVTIYSRVPGKPLSNFTLLVSDTLPNMTDAINRIQLVTAASKWSYRMDGTVSDRVTIPLPIGTTGKYVIIIAQGNSRTIALNDVQITKSPTIKIGTGFTGTIDDVRIYRKALTAADRDQLKAMAWQKSDTAIEDGYTTWSRPAIEGVEVNTRIQSMTVDNNNNSLVTAGENSLWQGAIDTRNPRITATNVNNTYSVQIDDRNLNAQQMATPCGSKLTFQEKLPTSLWFLQHMSVFDGTYTTPTRFTGTCTLAPYPEVIQTNSQIVSNTNTLVYGNRFAYMGGLNQIATLDVKPSTTIKQRETTIAGTVTQLSINRAKDKLYAISTQATSTQNGVSILTIFDIASNPLIPRQLGTLAITLPTGISIAQMGIAGSETADTYVMLADSSVPAKLWSIDVSTATAPRTGLISTIQAVGNNNTPTVYGMAVQNDIVVLALGIEGVAIYRIDNFGATNNPLSTYNTTGYAQNVFINGNDLLIIDDDEPFDGTNAPTSPNTLRTINLSTGDVSGNNVTLSSSLTERNTYRHITPFDNDNVVGYRIIDIVPYRTGELMLLSSATDYPNNQRISIINTAGNTALLKNDTRVNTTLPIRLATNSQNVIALTRQGTTTNLIGYQVSDARLDTYACDVLNNCTTTSSSSSTPITLGQTPPAQSSIRIINPATVYASDTQTIQVSAETATAGIASISLLVNGQIVQTHDITGAPQQVEDEFRLENLGSGTYTITTQFTDTQINPATVTSVPVETAIDLQAPQIKIIDTIVGATQIINNMYVVRVVITDDVGVDNIQIINKLTNARIPYSSKKQGNITTISVFYNPQRTDTQGLQLSVIATDRVGNTTTHDQTVKVDTMPPVTDATISITVNGKASPLSDEQTITQTNPINVAWTKVSDASPITLHNLEYVVTTVNGSTYTTTTTVPANSSSIAKGIFPTLTTTEASRVSAKVRLRDELGNEGATQLPVFYADTPQTPDYTLMNSTEPTYRGFVTNGCASLGEDRRPGLDNIQRFAMTWDSQAIRMNWQGADWEYDGNLFIYLDTIPGGTVQAYRPSNYTQSITNSVTLGESFITLPVNMAARSAAAGSSIASYVNDFQTALTQSQQGIRTSAVQGADYVIAINNRTNAQLLTWNGSAWVDTNSPITYQYVNERGIKQTDIRTLFSQIGYTTGNPLGVVAFATKPNSFMPWATFPSSNPVPVNQGNNKFTITPLLNGYGWSNLTSGVCPNTAALNPDSTQIMASLTSTPNGVFNRALADNFANTDPDAISQIINETASMCSTLTSDSWCNTVAQYGTVNNTGSALLDTLAGNLASEQDPVVGNNSVVTYTLKIQNPTNKPTRRMYGIVQTYGGIWLTDSNSSGTPPVAIIGGGNYTYHNISASGLRDYQLIQFNPIAANSSQTITFRAKIDPTKPQSSTSDRIKTSSIAKVEVRMVDDGTGTSPANFNVNRTVEWLNAAVAIDTSAPSQVLPDIQTVMTRGAFTITGSVQDQSTVSNVYLEYYTNTNSSSRTQINCGAASTGQWACPITIPNTATSITYRVRASDVYKQQSPWSGWYGATIDVTPPTFVLDPVTTSVSNASYVGGSAISLSGFLTDTTSTANIKVCDQSQALCEFGSTTNPTINQSVITGTATTDTQVTCKNTSTADYTSIPITISGGTNDQRLSSVTVDVKVTSAAANELDLWLRSPSGTLTPLMTSLRPSMVNLLARFDDNAVNATTSLSGTTNLAGTATAIKPDSALSLLNGEAVNGNWQLLACDRNTNNIISDINAWSITLNKSSASVSTNARWSYTVKNTNNQDNVTRKLTLWGVDAVNNTSASRIISLNIDTVAPNFTITQLLDTMLSGSTQTAFQGTLSEGGTLSSLSTNIYDSKTFVKNIPISVQSMQSQDLSRWNYLLSRTISNYTWQLPIDTTGFSPGTYKIQFIATDVAGNQRTSDAYTILVPEFTAPSITNISTANTFLNTTSTLTYKVDSGRGTARIDTSVALDSAVTAPITDTTLRMWGNNGSADSTAQAKIPAGLQNTLISQLEMNNHLAAALDSNGTLTTWALQNSNTVNVTTPISDVMQLSDIAQFAMGDSSNQHLLTLSNTGVITDYTPTGATSVPITDAVAIAAGTTHNLAIIKTGKLAAWGGSNTNGETTIPANATMGVSQIAAGNGFSLALKSDGRLIAWGKNNLDQITVPVSATTGIAQIAAGDNHGLALRADGVVVAWGDNSMGQTTIPVAVTDAIFIAANANSSAAVTSDGSVYVWGATRSVTNCCAGTSAIALNSTQILTNQVDSTQSQSYQIMPDWNANYYRNQFNGLIPGRRYKYEITIRNEFGTASYTGKFTTNQRYSTIYLPFLTNTDGATAVNTTSGK